MTLPGTSNLPGARARASNVRSSARKVRPVLDLIRGKGCVEAFETLELCERGAAVPVRKVLHSAVSNAENSELLDADELYVSTCYADEGRTLKRVRPRARGQATQILKRTCHITVVLSRYDSDRLDWLREQRSGIATSAESRRRRVARSRLRRRRDSGEMQPASESDTERRAAEVVRATEAAMSAGSAGDAAEAVDAAADTGTSRNELSGEGRES